MRDANKFDFNIEYRICSFVTDLIFSITLVSFYCLLCLYYTQNFVYIKFT